MAGAIKDGPGCSGVDDVDSVMTGRSATEVVKMAAAK